MSFPILLYLLYIDFVKRPQLNIQMKYGRTSVRLMPINTNAARVHKLNK